MFHRLKQYFVLCSKDHTSWANYLLKRGKRRAISDIRRSIGDGQTLVFILETLGMARDVVDTCDIAVNVHYF